MPDLSQFLQVVRERLAKALKGNLGTKAEYHRCHCATYRCSCDPILEDYFDNQPRLLALVEAGEVLTEYMMHDQTCTSARWQQGEPTPGGGYRTMYADKWYEKGEPVPCECGLTKALTRYTAAYQEVTKDD